MLAAIFITAVNRIIGQLTGTKDVMKEKLNMNQWIKRAAWTVAVGITSVSATAGDVSVDIHIGSPPPRPVILREEVVVVREEVVVREPVVYDTYVVGYRRNLYDTDLRLRLARSDEWQAHEELAAARRNEGELAVLLDEQEALIGPLRHRAGGREESLADLRARVSATADQTANLRKKLGALDHRVAAAKEDYDAAKTLHDDDGMEDAAERIKSNEARAAGTALELRDTEARLAHLRDEEAAVASIAADRARLHDAEARAADLHHKLDAAHDSVYSTQKRLTAAQDEVYLALHDRDESLWLLHRDEILLGRFEPERCGFHIDLAIWGGRMPRDPEVLHAYCVRDVGYWRGNPVYVEERVVQVDRVTEVTHIREIQRVREVEKIRRVEVVEKVVKVEDRRRVAEVTIVERKRYEAETVERKTAVTEHRAPRPVYIERPTIVKNSNNVTNVNTTNNTVNNTVNNSSSVNNTTVTNNNVTNVTNVTKVNGNAKEEARLKAEVRDANTKADSAKKLQVEEASKLRRDEAKLAEQSKQIESTRREERKTADEVAKLKTDEAAKSRRVDSKLAEQSKQIEATRRDERKTTDEVAKLKTDEARTEKKVEKVAEKSVERTADKSAEKTAEKPPERRADRSPDQPTDKPAVDSKRPAIASDSEPAPKARRRGDAADGNAAPQQPSARRGGTAAADSRDTKDPRDPKDPRNSRDARGARDPQSSTDDPSRR